MIFADWRVKLESNPTYSITALRSDYTVVSFDHSKQTAGYTITADPAASFVRSVSQLVKIGEYFSYMLRDMETASPFGNTVYLFSSVVHL